MTCLKCKTRSVPPENGARAPLCRECRTEMILSAEDVKLGVLDRVYADNPMGHSGTKTPISWEELLQITPVSSLEARRIRCEVCGASELYDPMKKRQGWPCARCHKHGLGCCMAYVTHQDFGMMAVALCKLCRTELVLSGQPCEEAHQTLPGKEAP